MSTIRFVDAVFLEKHLQSKKDPKRPTLILPEEQNPSVGLFEEMGPTGVSLNKLCIHHPAATFLMRLYGHEMKGAGFQDGDILIVDRAITPKENRFVIAPISGELRVAQLAFNKGRWHFMTNAPDSQTSMKPSLSDNNEEELETWGVITHIIRPV